MSGKTELHKHIKSSITIQNTGFVMRGKISGTGNSEFGEDTDGLMLK
jgi:hypothetical protein